MTIRLFLILFITALCFEAVANDGFYNAGPQGGMLYPASNSHIQMLKESVVYNQEKGRFVTEFTFYNRSDSAQQVLIAFPVMPPEGRWKAPSDTGKTTIQYIKEKMNFRTWIDGEPVERTLWKVDTSSKHGYAFTKEVRFAPKAKKKVVNKFDQGMGYGGINMGHKWRDITYILKTGAGWAGKIKQADIKFIMNQEEELKPFQTDTVISQDHFRSKRGTYCMVKNFEGWSFSPEPKRVDTQNNVVKWTFRNFEPDFNIRLTKRGGAVAFNCFHDYPYLDTLSEFIINKDTSGFVNYLGSIKNNPSISFDDTKKKNWNRLYLKAGQKFLSESDPQNYKALKHKTRHFINAFAALNGYEFRSFMWSEMFSLFSWYTPKTKKPAYSPEQQKIIDKLVKFERGDLIAAVSVKTNKKNGNKPGPETVPDPETGQQQKNRSAKCLKNNDDLSYEWEIVVLIIAGVFTGLIILKKRRRLKK